MRLCACLGPCALAKMCVRAHAASSHRPPCGRLPRNTVQSRVLRSHQFVHATLQLQPPMSSCGLEAQRRFLSFFYFYFQTVVAHRLSRFEIDSIELQHRSTVLTFCTAKLGRSISLFLRVCKSLRRRRKIMSIAIAGLMIKCRVYARTVWLNEKHHRP